MPMNCARPRHCWLGGNPYRSQQPLLRPDVVRVSEESVFPASRAELWRVLESNLDDSVVGKIHPFVISSRQSADDENGRVHERVWRKYGRAFSVTTRYDLVPMERFRWEVTASTGGLAPGSYIENRYSDAGKDKTKITTRGELTLVGVSGFLQGWIVRRSLNQSDNEDLRYLLRTRKEGP